MAHALIETFRAARVIPVVRTRSAKSAATVVGWLRDAGLRIFEITLTVPDAIALIRELAADPALLVGAGTVADAAAAVACLDAGAKFIVAPWIDTTLAAPCRDAGAALMLGAVTPSEVRAALSAGADVVKIFPASSVGGPGHIKALVSVLPDVPFCPTGGVAPGDVAAYLEAGAAVVGMGGALVDERRIAAGDREAIQAVARSDYGNFAPVSVDLLCMGEPMLEFNQLPPLPDGTRHYLEGHGGDTSNAAVAAARQGARVGMIAGLGRDMPGDSFMALWQREGIDTSTVWRTDRWLTGVYFVTHDVLGHHFLHYRANSAASMLGPDDVPVAAIGQARMLYLSGISQGISTIACDATLAAIEAARRSGVKVAYDTNYRPRLWPPARAAAMMRATMESVDYALPGIEDVQTLTGLTDPDAMLDFCLRLGPEVVVLKMGAAGAYLATPGARVRIPAFAVRVVDATGAGDTFCGSFLSRILAGDSPEPAARYAAVAAALKCTGYGAVGPIPSAARVLETLRSRLTGQQ